MSIARLCCKKSDHLSNLIPKTNKTPIFPLQNILIDVEGDAGLSSDVKLEFVANHEEVTSWNEEEDDDTLYF